MTNKPNGVLYVGVTDDIESRVQEHRNKLYKKSFTAKFNCDKLVYLEEFENGAEAAIREKQLKKWNRQWKINLIEEMNPGWMDIGMNWNNEDLIYKTKLSRVGGKLSY
jgi:putative endonuclease